MRLLLRLLRRLAGLCVLALAAQAGAQQQADAAAETTAATRTPAASPHWPLDQALATALARHPLVRSAQAQRQAAFAEWDTADWARYPTPAAEATTRSAGGQPAALLRLDQPLWTGGRIQAGIDAAGRRFHAATAAVAERRLELAQRVAAAYAEALRQQERHGHVRTGLAEHERLLALIRRRVAQEVSSQADERLAESRHQQAASEVLGVAQAARSAQAQLASLLGEPVPGPVTWQGLDPLRVSASLDAAQAAALEASALLRRLRLEEGAAEADIATRRSALAPQVVLRLEHARGGGAAPDTRALIVLQAQPGAGLSAFTGVDAAVARREAARHAREAAERELRERVELDWNDWASARERFELVRRAGEITAEVFDSFARQFVIGRKSWLEVLNAVRESTQAQLAVADARAQQLAAALRLQLLTGALPVDTAAR